MKRHSTLVILSALGLVASACMPLSDFGFDSSQPELVAFSSCGELEGFLRTQALAKASFQSTAFDLGRSYDALGFASDPMTSSGEPAPVEAATMSYSETNVQEDGVDEADIFKVDGRFAYALHGRKLIIIEALGDEVPDIGGDGPNLKINGGQVVAEVEVPGNPIEMYLSGDRVVVMTVRTQRDVQLLVGAQAADRPSGTEVLSAIVYDVTDRSRPAIEREVLAEGRYLSSRRIGNQVYIISRSLFTGPEEDEGSSTGIQLFDDAWMLARSASINSASMDEWLPYHYDVRHTDGAVSAAANRTDCTRTYASRATNGDQALSIYSFDLSLPTSELKNYTVLGDGAVVYASTKSIVVALTNYGEVTYGSQPSSNDSTGTDLFGDDWWGSDDTDNWGFDAASETVPETGERTYLHRFELGEEGSVKYHATGSVDGWILNQFSLSEYKGYIRVATMKNRDEWDAESMVFVLQSAQKSISLNAPLGNQSEFLSIVGELRGIGEEEDLYATRFVGDVGYLVTFRETDPLWVVDLRTPTKPVLRGHLEVPGYSTYLHPVDGQKLLAVGRGGFWGDSIKISLFDVGNLDNPRAIDEIEEGSSAESEALDEHRAFRYLPENQLLALPITDFGNSALYLYDVDMLSGFSLRRMVSHESMSQSGDAPIRRTYRIGDYLYAYSSAGVSIVELASLDLAANVDLEDL